MILGNLLNRDNTLPIQKSLSYYELSTTSPPVLASAYNNLAPVLFSTTYTNVPSRYDVREEKQKPVLVRFHTVSTCQDTPANMNLRKGSALFS